MTDLFSLFAEDLGESIRCVSHGDQELKCFCISCNTKVCSECAATLHIIPLGCKVIFLHEISEELPKQREKLMNDIKSARARLISVQQLLDDKEASSKSCQNDTRSRILRDAEELDGKVEKGRQKLMKQVESYESFYFDKMINTKQSYAKDEELLLRKGSADNALDMLRQIKERISNIVTNERTCKVIDTRSINLLYRAITNNGEFCYVTESTMIGSAVVYKNLMVNIFDERKSNRSVRQSLVDINNNSILYSSKLIKVDDCIHPVVMSQLAMHDDQSDYAIFAVGHKVFLSKLPGLFIDYDILDTTSTLVIKDIKNGSWITSIATHSPDNSIHCEFAVTMKDDYTIREYNITGNMLRKIDTRPLISTNELSSVAYHNSMFALICKEREDVILIAASERQRQCGSLNLPSSTSNMMPFNIIWTGAHWLVLYVSSVLGRNWKVATYTDSGDFLKVCDEGKSSNDMAVPVCVSRYGNIGYTSFADASVREFSY